MQKEFIVLYSKHIVHGGKVQNVKIFKNYYFKNVVHSCVISGVYMAPVQVHNKAKYEGSKLNQVVRTAT